jgi:hypothetical protein
MAGFAAAVWVDTEPVECSGEALGVQVWFAPAQASGRLRLADEESAADEWSAGNAPAERPAVALRLIAGAADNCCGRSAAVEVLR